MPRAMSPGAGRWLSVLRTPTGIGAAALLGAILLLALIAPPLWSEQADVIVTADLLQGPSAEHLIGTDNLGRDLFLRVLVATGISIQLALLATAIAVTIGLVLGSATVLLGPRAGRLVISGVNIAVAIPGLLLALFFAVIFGVGAVGAVLAIGLSGSPTFARLTHTLVSSIAERDYIAAARIAGANRFTILFRHFLPNIGEPLVVNATIGAGGALLAFAGLSFLGLGVQPPSYDWGQLLGTGLNRLYVNPAAALAPGLAVVVAGLAFNLFGETVAKGIGLPSVGIPLRPRMRPVTAFVPRATTAAVRSDAVLDVRDLNVVFPAAQGDVRPVRGVSLAIRRGEIVGIVGESGSGKSLTALAIARLVDEPGRVEAERIEFLGADLTSGSDRAHRHLLGSSLAVVFQDPMTSMNPTRRVGGQLAEVSEEHGGLSRTAARARAIDRLGEVHIPDPDRRASQYPHQFSGGMRQRAMIGMGLMGNPALIIADEPTTALDPTVQRQILDLLRSIRDEDGVAVLLISHDVSVIRELCDRVLVMYAGLIVEDLPVAELETSARHPYTRALIASVPTMSTDPARPLSAIPGRPVDPANVPTGCPYAARCPLADAACLDQNPPLVADAAGRRVACWHAGDPLPAEVAS